MKSILLAVIFVLVVKGKPVPPAQYVSISDITDPDDDELYSDGEEDYEFEEDDEYDEDLDDEDDGYDEDMSGDLTGDEIAEDQGNYKKRASTDLWKVNLMSNRTKGK